MYFTTIQRAMYIVFTFSFRFSPTLTHFCLFPNTFLFSQILDFIKLCTRDFSRVTFATELSTYLVYKSIFVIYYNYIFINLLFFFTVKLSIFSRLCVKHKRVMSKSTPRYRNSTPILKTTQVSDRYRQMSELLVSVLKKWYRASPS